MEESESTVRQTIENMEMEVKSLMQVYKTMENLRDNLLDDLRNIANDVSEKVKRNLEKIKPVDFDEIIRNAHQQFDVIKDTSSKSMTEKKENIMDNLEKPSKLVDSQTPGLKKRGVEEENETPEVITEVTSSEDKATKSTFSENADTGSDDKTAKKNGPSKSFFDDI